MDMSNETQPTPSHGGILVPGAIVTPAGLRYALVVAPKAAGETKMKWTTARKRDVPSANSYFDGLANTDAMAEAGSKLGQWARGLSIGGHSDWYVPSRDELELLYRAFKPTTYENHTWRSGDNPSSLPAGYPYTSQAPAQTERPEFKTGGAEAFEDEWYWASTQYSDGYAWTQYFYDGHQDGYDKSYEARARAVRRFLLA